MFILNFNAKCLWCYTIFMVTPLTVTPQKTGKYFQDIHGTAFLGVTRLANYVCYTPDLVAPPIPTMHQLSILISPKKKPSVIDFHVCGVTLPIKAGKSYLSCHI